MALGFLVGLVIGAGIAVFYSLAQDETPSEGDTPLEKLRLQAREAKQAAEEAAREKEQEMYREYNAAIHRRSDQA